jgi:2-amino-4-hydroxy-6-hydroxymethyldihydropteridine diphosphokinase
LLVEYGRTPRDLLYELKSIEKEMGREKTIRWGPRVIDIDILLFGEIVLDEGDLKIPHPELHKRKFVLIPLLEIEKDLVHPVFGERLSEFLRFIDRSQKVEFLCRISYEELGIDIEGQRE